MKFTYIIIALIFSVSLVPINSLSGNPDQKTEAVVIEELNNDDSSSQNTIRAIRPDAPDPLNNSIVGPNFFNNGISNLIANIISSSSSGNVQGPFSSTINAVPRFATTSGNLLKNSTVLVDDAGNIQINGITKNANTVRWPSTVGAAGTFLGSNGAGDLIYATPGGGGNVSAAVPFSTNNAILTTDTPSGLENIKESSVILDPSGNMSGIQTLSAITINATTLNGNATSATTAINFTGPLAGDITGTQGATVVSSVGGQTAANVAAATILANNATDTNVPNTIVRRDASGNFTAGTITANLSGNATTATTATTAVSTTNFTGSLSGDVTGTQGATVVSFVGGQSAANVASATLAANAATDTNVPNTIVRRDASGNFAAGTITANLAGNATTATSATTAGSSTSFTGALSGDVTGTQGATVVSFVGGQTAANIASGAVAANAATNANTPNTIVLRDASGNFSAGTITANLIGNVTGNLAGNATTATSATTATNFSGSLSGDVSGTQNATVVNTVGGQTAANIASGVVLANAATSNNTAGAIVRRDGSGNFAAGTITANLAGNATTATTATTAGSSTSFTGSLSGDVTGTQGATVVSFVGGQTAANVAAATTLANTATAANTPNTIVRRDASGNFAAGTITANLAGNATTATSATTAASSTSFTGSLSGDVTGTQGATVVSFVGGQSAANVASATIAANLATNANTPNTIVLRDASGNFNAGTITANLIGNVTGNVTGNATTATSATTATNFTGSLSGDVSGTQNATVVNTVGGQTAANIASGVVLANAATNVNTPGAIVRRDASGNFNAGTITANLTGNVTGNLTGNVTGNVSGNATTATTAGTATNFTGSLAGDVTGTQGATIVSFVGGQTAADVAAATTLANTATSNNMPNTLVLRDASGNFATNMITIAGTITNPTDVATKEYVDAIASLGLTPKEPALVVSTSDVTLAGLQTIDGILLTDNDRVLLVSQINAIENGLWLAETGSWMRPTDFATGTTAGSAYVLTLSGLVNAGSSWLCSTPTAVIDTDPIEFVLFSLPNQTTGANVGTGAGQIFRDKTGVTLNFKTIAAGPHMVVTNNANDVTLSTDATSANTPNTIVARNGSGNFSAGTITASLTGASSLNVLKTGDTMTGNLNMANQSEIRFQDFTGTGTYVGLRAPALVTASYTVDLPATAPTAGQFYKQ